MSEIVKKVQVFQSIMREKSNGPLCFRRVYKIQLIFDDINALRNNLGIGPTRLAELFSESFIRTLMTEIFRQLKKSDDAPTAVQKVPTRTGGPGDDTATETVTRNDGEETDKKASAANQDDDDELSDQEREIQDEFNADLDGTTKIAKDVRAYEDVDEESQVSEKREPAVEQD